MATKADGTDIIQSQASKEITADAYLHILRDCIAAMLALTISGDVTLSSAQAQNGVLQLNGTPGADFDVKVPAVTGLYLVINKSGKNATIKTPAGTGVVLATANSQMVFSDSVNVIPAAAAIAY